MNVFAILTTVAGMVLFFTALVVTLRANSGLRVSFWRNAEVIPAGSVAMRAVGAGLIVLGAVFLSADGWWWPLTVALVGPGVAFILITLHNSRAARARNPEHRRAGRRSEPVI